MIQREVLIGPPPAPVARLLLGDAYAIRPTLGDQAQADAFTKSMSAALDKMGRAA